MVRPEREVHDNSWGCAAVGLVLGIVALALIGVYDVVRAFTQ